MVFLVSFILYILNLSMLNEWYSIHSLSSGIPPYIILWIIGLLVELLLSK